MKQLFSLNNDRDYAASDSAIFGIGDFFVVIALTSSEGRVLHQLEYYEIQSLTVENLQKIFQTVNIDYPKIKIAKIALNTPHNILVPQNLAVHDNGLGLLKSTVTLSAESVAQADSVSRWQLKNIYPVSVQIIEFFQDKFSAVKFYHQSSLQLSSIAANEEKGVILANFNTKTFSVTIVKGHQFLFSQTFEYVTPEDVLYYFLKCCHQFSLKQEDVVLQLSGLIAKDSALYKELYQYFINISFRDAFWKTNDEYPQHFFTTLNDLAKCEL